MKIPGQIRTYCKFCNAHKVHKVKNQSKSKARTLSRGTRKHEKKLKGFGGKRAGKVTVKKQGKRQVVILQCTECNKKQTKVLGSRTKKKIEIKR